MNPTIVIKKGREKPLINQHPWIFSGAIADIIGEPSAGDIVDVVSADKTFLARGYWNARSQIQVRILTWEDEIIDASWWQTQIRCAIDLRLKQHIPDYNHNALPCRLINAENDFLPGLVIDCYRDTDDAIWLVFQALTYGIDCRKDELVSLIIDILEDYAGIAGHIKGVYERSDVDVRGREGLSTSTTGILWGDAPPERIIILSEGYHFLVTLKQGHKTGFYLDQRVNRQILHTTINDALLSLGEKDTFKVLNLFSYTGTFGLRSAVDHRVHITNVDSSMDALQTAEASVALNHQLDPEQFEFIQADVFEFLRDMADLGNEYDFVILDPPKFAHNKQQINSAARGYKDINLNAFKIVKSGGYLMTFSCSGAITRDLFQKIVFGALADSGRQAQIISHLGASPDHPIALTFPEGEYLKGLLLRVY